MTAETPSEKPRSNWLSITTIVILVLAAFAGITYYFGSPSVQPSATPTLGSCSGDPQIVVPSSFTANGSGRDFVPPSLTVVVGVNNTVAWVDEYPGTLVVVNSVAVPYGALQWDLNMTDSPAVNTQCIALTVLGPYSYVIREQGGGVSGSILVKASSQSATS
jgi:hypothetical protein